MALRKWNKQRKVIFPLLHSLPKQQMWGPLKSHFIFTQPKDHFYVLSFHTVWLLYEHTHNKLPTLEKVVPFPWNTVRKHTQILKNRSCLGHLTAFGSTLWAWQGRTLERDQKGISLRAFTERTGTDLCSRQHFLKAGVQGPYKGKQAAAPQGWGRPTLRPGLPRQAGRAALPQVCYKNSNLSKARNPRACSLLCNHVK